MYFSETNEMKVCYGCYKLHIAAAMGKTILKVGNSSNNVLISETSEMI